MGGVRPGGGSSPEGGGGFHVHDSIRRPTLQPRGLKNTKPEDNKPEVLEAEEEYRLSSCRVSCGMSASFSSSAMTSSSPATSSDLKYENDKH